ncbi:MAG TPA: hypothetical protein PLG47_06345, partial [Candidatus Dojkabacteria bacterium]|nr:hypothetical protein [Candidatus Dojkabacteria bacterium]
VYDVETNKWAEVVSEPKKEFKFEKGKWYKGKIDDHYIKFNYIENCKDYNRLFYTERIYEGKFERCEESWANTEFEKFALSNSVSLEEIQQYLPDGHPDKISKEEIKPVEPKQLKLKDLVEGEVYYQESPKWKYGYIFKYGMLKAICTQDFYLSDWGPNNFEYIQRLATPEEKQWLNVCIAEDKFVEKDYALRGYDMYGKALKSEPVKPNFDNCKIWIGDNPELSKKVQEKLFELGYKWNSGEKKVKLTDKPVLQIWKDKKITYSDDDKYYFNSDSRKEIFPSDLGITVEEEYKVGDWIIFTDLETNYREHNGDIVQITDINPDRVHTSWVNHTPESFSGGGFALDAYKKCFRKARPEEIPRPNCGSLEG